jgi:hypothetical protein
MDNLAIFHNYFKHYEPSGSCGKMSFVSQYSQRLIISNNSNNSNNTAYEVVIILRTK